MLNYIIVSEKTTQFVTIKQIRQRRLILLIIDRKFKNIIFSRPSKINKAHLTLLRIAKHAGKQYYFLYFYQFYYK